MNKEFNPMSFIQQLTELVINFIILYYIGCVFYDHRCALCQRLFAVKETSLYLLCLYCFCSSKQLQECCFFSLASHKIQLHFHSYQLIFKLINLTALNQDVWFIYQNTCEKEGVPNVEGYSFRFNIHRPLSTGSMTTIFKLPANKEN